MVRKCKNNEINKKKRALLGYALKHEGKTKVKEKKGIEKREREKKTWLEQGYFQWLFT